MERDTARRAGCRGGRRTLLRDAEIVVNRLERQLSVREALSAALLEHQELTADIVRLGRQLEDLVRQVGEIGTVESQKSKVKN
jgi:hypothetical protein